MDGCRLIMNSLCRLFCRCPEVGLGMESRGWERVLIVDRQRQRNYVCKISMFLFSQKWVLESESLNWIQARHRSNETIKSVYAMLLESVQTLFHTGFSRNLAFTNFFYITLESVSNPAYSCCVVVVLGKTDQNVLQPFWARDIDTTFKL
jgi:hypothetical protein